MRWILSLWLLGLSLPASAILLDCEQRADGTYLCVEVEGSSVPAGTRSEDKVERQPAVEQRYLKQAEAECEYREPRRRMGKASSASLVEERKLAREAYEECLQRTARELRDADR
jgi:hypothetical protein